MNEHLHFGNIPNEFVNTPKHTEDSNSDFMVTGCGFMEKKRVDPKRYRESSYWMKTYDQDRTDTGQHEYMTRLTILRDSLIQQEQVALAKAVERLCLHSISNKNRTDRLRMRGSDVKKCDPSIQRTNMLTTVEKFRLMRPQVSRPGILPLQGKQIFKNLSQKRPSYDGNGRHKDGSGNVPGGYGWTGETAALLTSLEEDDPIQSNLLRLMQATSIPNIGEKQNGSKERVETKTKILTNSRPRLDKQMSIPFLPVNNGRSFNCSSSLQSQTIPKTSLSNFPAHRNVKVSARLSSPGACKPDLKYANDDMDVENAPNGYQSISSESLDTRKDFVDRIDYGRKFYRNVPSRQKNLSKVTHLNIYNPDKLKKHKNPGGTAKNTMYSDMNERSYSQINTAYNCAIRRVTECSFGIIRLLPEELPAKSIIKNDIVFNHSNVDENSFKTVQFKDPRFPGTNQFYTDIKHPIDESLSNFMKTPQNTSCSGFELSVHDVFEVHKGDNEHVPKGTYSKLHESDKYVPRQRETLENRRMKKRIVVDMPNIIFNAPSPVPDFVCDDDDEKVEINQNEILNKNKTSDPSLRETAEQQEKRMQELTNLLEDVKELSMKTESLKLHSATEVAIQQSIL